MEINKLENIEQQVQMLKKNNISTIDLNLDNMDDTKEISSFCCLCAQNGIKIASFVPKRKLSAQSPDDLELCRTFMHLGILPNWGVLR